jgi:Domain of unknown function (DUF4411)
MLWNWIGDEIGARRFTIPRVALDETGHKSPDCQKWPKGNSIEEIATTQTVITYALSMKSILGIVNDRYNPSGVDENDLLIIASAKATGCELISNEARQPALPKSMLKYKIPAVCSIPTVNVPCVDFLEILTRSGKSFG